MVKRQSKLPRRLERNPNRGTLYIGKHNRLWSPQYVGGDSLPQTDSPDQIVYPRSGWGVTPVPGRVDYPVKHRFQVTRSIIRSNRCHQTPVTSTSTEASWAMGESTERSQSLPKPVSMITKRAHPGGDCLNYEGNSGHMNEDQSRAAIPAGPGNAPGCPLWANPGGAGNEGYLGVDHITPSSKGSANGKSA